MQQSHSFLKQQFEYLRLRSADPASGFLFNGRPETGKLVAAEYFISLLLCEKSSNDSPCSRCDSCIRLQYKTHPDYFTVAPRDGKADISIDQIHELSQALSSKSVLSSYAVVLFKDADRLTTSAANALLKILEEPRGRTVYIFLNNRSGSILPTIISRCESIKFNTLTNTQIKKYLSEFDISETIKEEIVFVSQGRPMLAERLLSAHEERTSLVKYFYELLDNCIQGYHQTNSQSNSKNTSWNEKQIAYVRLLDDYKYIWHNILLYKLGLASHPKTYHNQKALMDFLAKTSLTTIREKLENTSDAKRLLALSVPGESLIEQIT